MRGGTFGNAEKRRRAQRESEDAHEERVGTVEEIILRTVTDALVEVL
jgi:hypothetical protein